MPSGNMPTPPVGDGFQLYKAKILNSNPIQASADGEPVYGTTGNDAMRGSAFDDFLIGGAGHDYLGGGAGSDILAASAYPGARSGVDTIDSFNVLEGGADNDLLVGDLGTDYFVFGRNSGTDLVLNFNADPNNHDSIVIERNVNRSGIKSFADMQNHATDVPEGPNNLGGVYVDLGAGNGFLLADVSKAELTADMFEFRYFSILDVPSG